MLHTVNRDTLVSRKKKSFFKSLLIQMSSKDDVPLTDIICNAFR